ncbi:hypothetical protein FQN51_004522 [Onygenales sp. PD_10]|nr:hypothetical protein FQN51_004522 [Onygenales sp. PD_10]
MAQYVRRPDSLAGGLNSLIRDTSTDGSSDGSQHSFRDGGVPPPPFQLDDSRRRALISAARDQESAARTREPLKNTWLFSDVANDSSSDDSPVDDIESAIEMGRPTAVSRVRRRVGRVGVRQDGDRSGSRSSSTSSSPPRSRDGSPVQTRISHAENAMRIATEQLAALQEIKDREQRVPNPPYSLPRSNPPFNRSRHHEVYEEETDDDDDNYDDPVEGYEEETDDDDDNDDLYNGPIIGQIRRKIPTVATTTSATRMAEEPRIVFKHHTISEDLSREEKDKGAKLQYLNKKLGGRLELRNTRLR